MPFRRTYQWSVRRRRHSLLSWGSEPNWVFDRPTSPSWIVRIYSPSWIVFYRWGGAFVHQLGVLPDMSTNRCKPICSPRRPNPWSIVYAISVYAFWPWWRLGVKYGQSPTIIVDFLHEANHWSSSKKNIEWKEKGHTSHLKVILLWYNSDRDASLIVQTGHIEPGGGMTYRTTIVLPVDDTPSILLISLQVNIN